MPKTIIEAFPKEKRVARQDGSPILRVSECFTDTIQGENFVGIPSTFLRLQGCTLQCQWCDTTEVWRVGNPYNVNELLDLWEDTGVIRNLKNGQHLIFTGGSPMIQQQSLIELIVIFHARYGFRPFIEVENECVVKPLLEFRLMVNRWNNSPKTSNSGNSLGRMYKPEIIRLLAGLPDSWFKFVVACPEDWDEIEEKFLKPGLIRKDQIVLMPEGATREELQKHYQFTIDMAIKHNVRMTDRMHVTIFNRKVGV